MQKLLPQFFEKVREQSIEIYNEFSLQHELGVFLRSHFPNDKVQFERNVSHFFPEQRSFTKREIDISVFQRSSREKSLECKSVIELKFPRNGQYPEQMFSFCKDIAFLEQLKAAGFQAATFLAVVDDPNFSSGSWHARSSPLYGMFRGGQPIHGEITKPTGSRNETIAISGIYRIEWKEIGSSLRYAHVEI